MNYLTRSMSNYGCLLLLCCGCMASSDSPDVTLEKGNILADRGKYDDAIPVYTRAIEAFRDRPDVYYKRGVCYENLQLFEKALVDYTKCLELDPEYADAINNKGVVLAQVQKFQEAADQFTLLVDKYPDNVLALRNRGLCLHDLGKYSESIQDYEKAIELDETDAQTWFQKGNVFLEQDMFGEAIADFNKAIELDVGYAKAWMNRGVAQYHRGNKAEAMADLRQSSELDENIVIPGIDWADASAAPEADVVIVAKPVFSEDVSTWNTVELFVKDFLVKNGYGTVTVTAAYAELQCALVSATKNDISFQVYVGVEQDGKVSLPAPSGVADESRAMLLVVKSERKSAGEAAQLSVAQVNENWSPGRLNPVVVEIPVASKAAAK